MELYLTDNERINFTQMARRGHSCESRFRQNFKKSFDWLSFNKYFLKPTKGHRIAIAIDCGGNILEVGHRQVDQI